MIRMGLPVTDTLGWIATAVFVASYFFSRPAALRGCQMLGAALWIGYGVLIGAKPVIAANLLVFAAAAWTLTRRMKVMPPAPTTAALPSRVR
jgi:hypothetical protein